MCEVVLSVCFVKASLRTGALNKGVVCIWEHEALSGTFEAERALSAKALRQECDWGIEGPARRTGWLE